MADDAQYDPYAGIETPQSLAAKKYAAFQAQLQAAQPQNTGAMFGAQTAGMLAGQGISDLADAVAPSQRMQQAQQNAGAMQQAAGMTPDQLDALAASGKVPVTMVPALQNKAAIMRQQQSKLLSDFTGQTKDMAAANKDDLRGRVATPQESASLDARFGKPPPGHAWVIKPDGTPDVVGANSGTTVNVGPDNNQFLVPQLKRVTDAYNTAQQAYNNINTLDSMRDQVTAAAPLRGAGAALKERVATTLSTLGLGTFDASLQADEALKAQSTMLAAGMAKGLVNRLTQFELKLFKQAAAGDETAAATTMNTVLDLRRKIFEEQITDYNNIHSKMTSKNDMLGQQVSRAYDQMEVPKYVPGASGGGAGGTVTLYKNGKQYNIPADKADDAQKNHGYTDKP